MKIAIVGAQGSKWTKEQKVKAIKKINEIFHSWRYATEEHLPKLKSPLLLHITLISGHCPKGGVDIWAEEIADKLRIQKEIYFPDIYQWENKRVRLDEYNPSMLRYRTEKGYKSRNIQIAEACDILYCIVPKRYHGILKYKRLPSYKDLHCIHCNVDGHPTNGGCWTMNYTKKLGKKVFLIEIE